MRYSTRLVADPEPILLCTHLSAAPTPGSS
jgi:hypothetical protein